MRIERASFGAEAWPRKYFLELYRDCRDFFAVAKVGGRIAGYAVACADKRNAEVASLAVYLCSDAARSITGANLSIDGGWTAA